MKSFTQRCLGAVAVLLSLSCAPVLADDLADIKARGELRHLGINYANFVTGAGDGFDVELVQGFAKHIGVKYKLVPTHDKGFKLTTVIDWLRGQIKVPVLTGLPFGHVETKVLLPVGAKVDLVTEERDALMVWGHV